MDLLLPDQREREAETVVFFHGTPVFFGGGGGVQLATFPNAFFSSFLLDFDLTSFFIHSFFSLMEWGTQLHSTCRFFVTYSLFFVCIPFYFFFVSETTFWRLKNPKLCDVQEGKNLYKKEKLTVKSCWFLLCRWKECMKYFVLT